MKFQRHLGKYILQLREEAGLSQEELALKIGKTKSLVSFIETKGKVSDGTLMAISDALKVPFEMLKIYPFVDIESSAKETISLKNKIAELEKENQLLRTVISGQEKVIALLETHQKK